mmetsp:Transcript_15117/g.40542  ORF Transcript_15117/g.40542 Transcript_15117/m.40542 type:complete len:213 (-) Transcript_15117:113-751(-)
MRDSIDWTCWPSAGTFIFSTSYIARRFFTRCSTDGPSSRASGSKPTLTHHSKLPLLIGRRRIGVSWPFPSVPASTSPCARPFWPKYSTSAPLCFKNLLMSSSTLNSTACLASFARLSALRPSSKPARSLAIAMEATSFRRATSCSHWESRSTIVHNAIHVSGGFSGAGQRTVAECSLCCSALSTIIFSLLSCFHKATSSMGTMSSGKTYSVR